MVRRWTRLFPSRLVALDRVDSTNDEAKRAALAELVPAAAFQVKWPNDILCRGRKIAGMLLEQAPPYVVVGIGIGIGIGVDVAHAPEPGLYPTTCLRQLGSGAEPFDVLAGPVTVRLSDETTMEGTFSGLDAEGALLLDRADGSQRKILAGDVFFPR